MNGIKKVSIRILLWMVPILLLACSDDDPITDPDGKEPEEKCQNDGENGNEVDGLEIINCELVYEGYILVNDAAANRVYLMDKMAQVVYEWNLSGKRLGNDVYLMPNGKLLAMLESESPSIKIGGFGGVIAILDKDGAVEWSYEYSSQDHIAHHDAEILPNGNILFMTWERKSKEEANAIGYALDTEIIYDAIKEINPGTNEIVWEWHMWDHLIQDHDDTKTNYGNISENPQLININYVVEPDVPGDVSHANGIAYDAEKDLIYLSANFYNEIWVIDHSTSLEESASHSGGNQGKGGDLVYRFGNPSAYGNNMGMRIFDRNHHPNLLQGEKKGHILVFSNGFSQEQSVAYELKLPNALVLAPNTDNEPQVVWSFTDSNLYSGKVSGVDLLPNGNRLITEGDFGFWEVSEAGEVVWRYSSAGFFWRGYHFDKSAPGIQELGL